MEAISTAFGNAIGTMQTDILGILGVALPVVLGIVGAVLAVRFGIKFVRKFAQG